LLYRRSLAGPYWEANPIQRTRGHRPPGSKCMPCPAPTARRRLHKRTISTIAKRACSWWCDLRKRNYRSICNGPLRTQRQTQCGCAPKRHGHSLSRICCDVSVALVDRCVGPMIVACPWRGPTAVTNGNKFNVPRGKIRSSDESSDASSATALGYSLSGLEGAGDEIVELGRSFTGIAWL
jgi:hypothetical protein